MHVEAGHNSSAPDDLPKDLRCPLCLYHTKNKSNMIDHIVLHRGTHRANQGHAKLYFSKERSDIMWCLAESRMDYFLACV